MKHSAWMGVAMLSATAAEAHVAAPPHMHSSDGFMIAIMAVAVIGGLVMLRGG